jgi:hypothetical protein
MRRLRVAVLAGIVLSVALAGSVVAVSGDASPESQSHSHGVQATWTLTWGGAKPYEVLWSRGDTTGLWWPSTNSTSYTDHYAFYPCSRTQYAQLLRVWANDGGFAADGTIATENGGNPC